VVGCWLASHPPEMGASGRGSHPHRAKVGLDDLCLYCVLGAADVGPFTPAELMAWADAAGQRPSLVVVRATSAHRISGGHHLNASPGMRLAQRDGQLSANRCTNPSMTRGSCGCWGLQPLRRVLAHRVQRDNEAMSTHSSWYRPRSTSHRFVSAVTVAVVASSGFGLAAVTSVVSAAPASAHAELVRITPDVDAQLTTAPKDVVLEFNELVSTSFATVVVTSAAGVSVTSGKPTVIGATVTQTLVPHLATGTYRVAYRVVSNDGHPVTGESGFTLTPAPTTNPSASPPSASPPAMPAAATTDVRPPPSPDTGQTRGLSRSGLATAGAFALLLIGAGLLVWRRKHP